MSVEVRKYQPSDYEQVVALYKQSELFGGQYDDNRDAADRLHKRIEADPDAIIVAEHEDRIVGTVSLIEDGRVAWLFRFAVDQVPEEDDIAQQLCAYALKALRNRGHAQTLVYTPVGNAHLDERYEKLGFARGSDYTCYWKDI